MNENERQALAQGYERMSAWARLLDRINVFPVADGDTGRNLVVSLAPLRRLELSGDKLMRALLLSARGNSGNIAARFMEGLLQSGDVELSLPERVSRGRDLAHTAVADPKPGTMLTLLDELTAGLEHGGGLAGEAAAAVLTQRLERSVHETTAQLPALQEAKVVDAGALGLFLLFETFIWSLIGAPGRVREVKEAFPAMVAFSPVAAEATADHGFCVDAVLRAADLDERSLRGLAELGDSAVTLSHGEYVKVHLHTDDQDALRARLEGFGPVVQWRWDDLEQQTRSYSRARPEPCLHVMTDAAGSFTRDQAEELGVTLLCSYINVSDDLSLPETHLDPSELYGAMGRGVKVSTSQASVRRTPAPATCSFIPTSTSRAPATRMA